MTGTGPDGRNGRAREAILLLSAVALRCGEAVMAGPGDPPVAGITLDSRSVRPGDLFVALPSTDRHESSHGARHVADAVAAGAVAVLTDSVGARLVDRSGLPVPRLVVGDPAVVLGPVAAAVHGDPAADLTLVGVTGTVIVVDDAWGRRLAAESRIPVITLADLSRSIPHPDAADNGDDRSATWHLTGEVGSDDFVLHGPDGDLRLHTPLPGEHNRVNTAVAALLLLQLGVSAEQVVGALAGPVDVPGRMQRLHLGPGAPVAVVDFVHTPDGMARAAAALRHRHAGRPVLTVSAGGDRDAGKRELIGRAAAMSGADVLVVTDDHPRTEDPATIRAAILRGVRGALTELRAARRAEPRVIEVVEGRRRALEVTLSEAGPDGAIGFFGLGPDRFQHIGPHEALVPFVETEEIQAAWDRHSGAAPPPPVASP
ncbi:glutamate ligase domain-containing protein [Tersicoccus sp. Bi-70]|uniref:glutamate ligase domain-containing protein n=1 Tax=Tersicoccus sp. Bi-70 TaxID=1897634 RepID=UPI000977F233|nr:cyanophycin synthetase [Tersicoccus sp. Bi-70]OMH34089.1 hypothetical protein BGP79_02670 [Tersicoccus sp. Bi-70]